MLLLANIEVPNAMMTQFTADIPAAWGPHAVPRMQQVLAHPNFDRAVAVYLDGMVKAHRGHPMLNHLMSEIGRFTTVSLGLYLHAGGGLDGFRDGLTLTRLQDLIGGLRVASRGRVEAVVRELVQGEFMLVGTDDADRRRRPLIPTDKLKHAMLAWQIPHMAAIDLLRPEPGFATKLAGDHAFYLALQRSLGDRFLSGVHLALPFTDMLEFFNHDCGYMLLLCLLAAPPVESGSNFGRTVRMPFSEVIQGNGISRSHVRRLMLAAEEKGLVRIEAAGGQVIAIAPRLDLTFREWMAATFWCFETDAETALRHCQNETGIIAPKSGQANKPKTC